MPLHEAIETVLRNSGRAMHANDVAAETNRRELYERGDSQPLDGAQARARDAKAEYRDRFIVEAGVISLA